jgi:hypothetical protein
MLAEQPARYRIVEDGGYGFIDETGNVVIPPQFAWAGNYHNGRAHIFICGGDAVIDTSGTIIEGPVDLDSAGESPEALRPYQAGNSKFGFKDSQGRVVINPRFEEVSTFRSGVAPARKGKLWGYIDQSGAWVERPRFNFAASFDEQGIALVSDEHDDLRIINRSFQYVFNTGKPWMGSYPLDGLMINEFDGKLGYVRIDGSIAIAPQFTYADAFAEGLAPASRESELIGYIDVTGRFVISEQFEKAFPHSHGLAAVTKNGMWQYIDLKGNTVISLPEANWALAFDEHGVAGVQSDDGTGYINRVGSKIWWSKSLSTFDHPPLIAPSKEEIRRSCIGLEKTYPAVLEYALKHAAQ